MNKKEYNYQQMLREYDLLKGEILQAYDQQMNLIFGAGVTAVSALALSIIQSSVLLIGLPVLLGILIGIVKKSISNYHRIYRIASYITIIHEQEGLPTGRDKLSLYHIAWHTRLRKIARSGALSWKGGGAAKADAFFLFLLGIGSWILVVGKFGTLLLDNFTNIALITFSLILTIIFFNSVYNLNNAFRLALIYEDEFRQQLENE